LLSGAQTLVARQHESGYHTLSTSTAHSHKRTLRCLLVSRIDRSERVNSTHIGGPDPGDPTGAGNRVRRKRAVSIEDLSGGLRPGSALLRPARQVRYELGSGGHVRVGGDEHGAPEKEQAAKDHGRGVLAGHFATDNENGSVRTRRHVVGG
jgi:hypothetical protein